MPSDDEAFEMLMESLDDFVEDEAMDLEQRCWVLPILIASYFNEIPEASIPLLCEEADLDLDDPETAQRLKTSFNVLHFNDVLRIVDQREDSIIDPSSESVFRSMTSPEHINYMNNLIESVHMARNVKASFSN